MSLQDERPLSEVITDIFGNLQDMVRSEMRLAKVELKHEVTEAARAGTFLASGLGLAPYALGFLLLAGMFLLARIMDVWLAALIICLLVSALSATLITVGRHRAKKLKLAPPKTVQSVKEDVSWMKAQIK